MAEKKGRKRRLVYLDNNATTMMPEGVVREMLRWVNRGNASSAYASAREAREMMAGFRRALAEAGGYALEGDGAYAVLFTSGASESNSHIVRAAAQAYKAKTGKKPHLVVSAVEHRSLLACALRLARDRLAEVTLLPVRAEGPELGTVDPAALRAALRPNTCLVAVMAANNETGAISDLRALGEVARAADVPLHADAVQLFGRSAFRPGDLGVDSFSASFHKLHGPPGVGLLVVRRVLVENYDLPALVCGTQNGGLRGGTENLPALGGAAAAFRLALADRRAKNRRVRRLRDALWAGLGRAGPAVTLDAYRAVWREAWDEGARALARAPALAPPDPALARALREAELEDRPAYVWVAPSDPRRVLPNTLLLAVRRRAPFCNVRARDALERRGVIVSVGSACDTGDAHASHVVDAIDLPPELRGGVLRVSLGDDTTEDDVAAFLRVFPEVVAGADVLADE